MTESISDELLARLKAAGEAGLTPSALLKGKPKTRPEREAALAEWIAQRRIANLGAAKKPRFVLQEHYKPLDLAYAAVEAKATPGKANTFLAKDLAKGTAGAVRNHIDEAVALLLREKKLIRLQRGKMVFYLHSASIQPLVDFGDSPPPAAGPGSGETAFSESAVQQAYAELARENGFSHVPISDLQKRSGAPLSDLQDWLRQLSREGRARLARGDWSLSNDEARAASIKLNGEPYLLVQLT